MKILYIVKTNKILNEKMSNITKKVHFTHDFVILCKLAG